MGEACKQRVHIVIACFLNYCFVFFLLTETVFLCELFCFNKFTVTILWSCFLLITSFILIIHLMPKPKMVHDDEIYHSEINLGLSHEDAMALSLTLTNCPLWLTIDPPSHH